MSDSLNVLRRHGFHAALFLMLAMALALRIAGARGDLWLDEIWTLNLLRQVDGPAQIFWKIPHDNNHFLNSLWLYLAGPDAPVWARRGAAILLGTASAAAAGWWGLARSRLACTITTLLFAVAYAMVQYGSEARGYAGLILFTLLALRLAEEMLQGRDHRRWAFAMVALLGVLSHLSMVLTLAVIGAWAAYVQARARKPWANTLAMTARMFLPAVLAVSPVVLLVLYQSLTGGFVIGMPNQFSSHDFAGSYGLLLRALTGVPGATIAATYLLLPCLALVLGFLWRRDLGNRLPLYLIAVMGLPIALFALRVPGTDQPRYFLVAGIVYLLLVSDLAAIAWQKGRFIRGTGMLVLLVFLSQESLYLTRFFAGQRGHYDAAIVAMTARGPATYATDDEFRNGMIVDYYAMQRGVTASLVPKAGMCQTPPDWYLAFTFSHEAPPPTVTMGLDGCTQSFADPIVYPYWGMSGFTWILYRRQ